MNNLTMDQVRENISANRKRSEEERLYYGFPEWQWYRMRRFEQLRLMDALDLWWFEGSTE